jgi:smad nuclear-interacting protein 1
VLQYRNVAVIKKPTIDNNVIITKQQQEMQIKPYIIDLGSTNGTLLNGEKIPTQRYIELKSGDIIKFGTSTRDYVLVNDSITN